MVFTFNIGAAPGLLTLFDTYDKPIELLNMTTPGNGVMTDGEEHKINNIECCPEEHRAGVPQNMDTPQIQRQITVGLRCDTVQLCNKEQFEVMGIMGNRMIRLN